MTSPERVMLLIDADNVSVDIMEQGLRLLMNQHGAVHVRRAYCTAESAVKHQAFFKRLSIKPMVNLAAGKNSTDIALAVDAIDLVLAERPDVVVIASSDSDFAPLVARLREKGCVVRGIGQKGKTGDETQDAYDDYTVLEHHASADAPARAPRRAAAKRSSGTAAKAPAAKKAPARKSAAAKAKAEAPPPPSEPAAAPARKAARKTAPRKTAAGKAAAARAAAEAADDAAFEFELVAPRPAPAPAPAPVVAPLQPPAASPTPARGGRRGGGTGTGGVDIDAVLGCLPELRAGQALALNVAVQRLREAQLLGKNSSSLKLFSQLGERFELLPADKPSQVRLRR